MNNDYTASYSVNQLTRLIKELNNLNAGVPADLLAEAAISDELKILDARNEATRMSAMEKLRNVPTDKFEEELAKVQKTWTETAALDRDGFTGHVATVRANRLFRGLYDTREGLFRGLADNMNQVVEHHRLNEHRLPGNIHEFNVMSATIQDIEAINAFKAATPTLNSLWNGYKRLSTQLGESLAIDLDSSTTLDVVFTIGAVTDFYLADGMCAPLYAATQNTTSTKNVSQIAPWGILNLYGVAIDVKTPDEAQKLRNKVQFGDAA